MFCIFSSSFDGPDDDSSLDMREIDGRTRKDSKSISREIPIFLSCAAPDEFIVYLCFSIQGGVILSVKLPHLYLFAWNVSLGFNDKDECPP